MQIAECISRHHAGLVSAMNQALQAGKYRTYGYICFGALSYDPVPNGGEGPQGQIQSDDALSSVADQVGMAPQPGP